MNNVKVSESQYMGYIKSYREKCNPNLYKICVFLDVIAKIHKK